ncbi:hypothetical protein M569_09297, partial [Genlisea aurea]
MKRFKVESPGARRFKQYYLLLGLVALYLILVFFKFPEYLETTSVFSLDDNRRLDRLLFGDDGDDEAIKSHVSSDSSYRLLHDIEGNFVKFNEGEASKEQRSSPVLLKPGHEKFGRLTSEILKRMDKASNATALEEVANEARALGLKAWKEVTKYDGKEMEMSTILEGKPESCPSWISMTEEELAKKDLLMFLPCGLSAGSSITVVGTPHLAHQEYVPQLVKKRAEEGLVLVSQFMVELQGLKAVNGEDPPKILHLNPRLRGDWSHQQVIEHNTCYRMQWGRAQRCDGIPSKSDDDMLAVDGYVRCEKWMRNDIIDAKESKIFSWFQRFIGRDKKPEVTWPFPFREGRMFVLTMRAGVDGFHINAGGRHVTSFPYRMGFTLEDATGLAIKGDVDVHSVYATSLPTSHPSFSPHRVLDFSEKWRSHPPRGRLKLFIGVISATNHFAERMAVRKTWMQSFPVEHSEVAVRFFVALNTRTEVNAILKKEAAFFGDIEILPFMDHYELVVLKTIAICEYGVRNVSTPYVMKCDDDNFVRVDTVLKEIEEVSDGRPLYLGNLNLLHRPLRTGKWAVSYEEWPEEIYPPYANGPGYIISGDIARYIVSHHANSTLRLFKMEDVSMGMWVEQLNASKPVQYSHNWNYCQYGCMENYHTAHYQSPRQMFCLWDHLTKGHPRCCN